ncbi:MAG: hypothetical protein NC123_01955 [Butyrivibrio sp.]|nr:hypothetical protein [Acetatifactor muris]MCM1558303.1 hypothetical protein [Butyrivibrio sp.]
MQITVDGLTNWECVGELSVGGLEWVGFSKEHCNKLLCISSQRCTLMDCKTGIIDECDCEYDEVTHTALCSLLPDDVIYISGQYGGKILHSTQKRDKVRIEIHADNRTSVYFANDSQFETIIFNDYGFYTCGFSYDGEYFVFAQDAGITLLRRV